MSLKGWVVSSFQTSECKQLEKVGCKKTAGRKRPRQQFDSFQKSGNSFQKSNIDNTWVEKYCPQNKDELAIHKRKVEEVENWLISSLKNSSSKQRILMISGPTGSGKTATVRTIAKHLKVEIQEWSNPVSHRSQQTDSWQESQTNLFREFLTRANKYNNLQKDDNHNNKKLILVEDFPNAFHMDASELHRILRRYNAIGQSPLVLIVTDCYERSLFPKDFQLELGTTLISFNPVAPTNLLKTLTRIACKGSETKPGRDVLQELSETANGDIRAAINSLQFYCSGNCKPTQGKPLRTIGSRDSSLVIFRGLGKILYCKREGQIEKHHTLPAHLKHLERSKLVDDPQDILRKTPMSPETLALFLHENYIHFFPGLEDLVRASDYFSVADALQCEWASKDVLEEYGALVTTLGLMNSNRGSKSTWRPLHKPQHLQVNKMMLQRTASARRLFLGNCSWSSDELFTVRLPFLQICRPPWLLPGQKHFIRELVGRNRKQIHSDVFDERDNYISENLDEETVDNYQTLNSVDALPVVAEDQDDPEMSIQEYSD